LRDPPKHMYQDGMAPRRNEIGDVAIGGDNLVRLENVLYQTGEQQAQVQRSATDQRQQQACRTPRREPGGDEGPATGERLAELRAYSPQRIENTKLAHPFDPEPAEPPRSAEGEPRQ